MVFESSTGYLLYMGDYTTQFYSDENKPLERSLLTNQYFMECHMGFEHCSLGVVLWITSVGVGVDSSTILINVYKIEDGKPAIPCWILHLELFFVDLDYGTCFFVPFGPWPFKEKISGK